MPLEIARDVDADEVREPDGEQKHDPADRQHLAY